jgi:hypothetical protein
MKKSIIIIITLIIIDILAIGGWTLYFKPSHDMAIVLIYMIPLVILINIIIASIMFFIKKYYTPFFILNIFISVVMLIFFFDWYSYTPTSKEYQYLEFKIDNIDYRIYCAPFRKLGNKYSITVDLGGGLFRRYDDGIINKQNDTIYFFSVDNTQYYIYKEYLYNFKGIDKIKVNRTNLLNFPNTLDE